MSNKEENNKQPEEANISAQDYLTPEDIGEGAILHMGFKVWFLLFVGDPYSPERALEKLRAMPDKEEAKRIWKRVKRSSMYKDDFKGMRL